MLKTSRELQIQFSELKTRMDERIGKPLDIPMPQQGLDGAWLYPGDYFPPFPGAPVGENAVEPDFGAMYTETAPRYLIWGRCMF